MPENTSDNIYFPSLAIDARAEEAVPAFQRLLEEQMGKCTLFVMACDSANQYREKVFEAVYESLTGFSHRKQALPVVMLELTPHQAGFTDWCSFPETTVFRCLAIETAASETMRDKLKETLWQFRKGDHHKCNEAASPSAESLHIEQEKEKVDSVWFRVRNVGVFVPATRTKSAKAVRTHSFHHGSGHFYRYRVATDKLALLATLFRAVNEYLVSIFEDCPNHLFRTRPRVSAQKLLTEFPLTVSTDHEVIRMAKAGAATGRYKAHDNVEVYLLENDPNTIASEIPLWVERSELQASGLAHCPLEYITGHIDVLRWRGDMLEIWDYKPKASLEEHATGQVLLYALVLAARTSFPLSQITVGYFDEEVAYFCNAHEQRLVPDQDWVGSRTD